MNLLSLQSEMRALGDPEKAAQAERFFKNGPGEYGEGDRFLGLRMPEIRQLSKKYRLLPVEDVLALLQDGFHEERMLALLIWVEQYKRGTVEEKTGIYDLYLQQRAWINNWDLVDVTAPHIVGAHLLTRNRDVLYRLAESEILWDRRIAMLSTFPLIRHHEFTDTLQLAEILIADPEDLMHKAVGWMLREVGNRDQDLEIKFLDQHLHRMPRTMLRYAIEKFPEKRRQSYLQA